MVNIDFTLNKTNLYEQMADTLEEAILHSKIKTEKFPSEQELSKRFNVSRTVTREALKVLKDRGLIQSKNGDGSYTTKPNRATISNALNRLIHMDNISDDELYNMRIILESAGAHLAAENASQEDIRHLEDILVEMTSEDPLPAEKRVILDSDFHVTIAKASGNKLLWIFVEVMTALLRDYMIKGLPHPYDLQNTIKEHKKIIESLKKKDADKAEAAIRGHLGNSLKNIKIYKQEHGE